MSKALTLVKRALAQAGENVNGLLFAAGVILLLSGVRAWSPPAAAVVGGLIVMALGAVPYVLKFRNRKGGV